MRSETTTPQLSAPAIAIGIGGYGCQVASQFLELSRSTLCGADGEALLGQDGFAPGMRPHELPQTIQTVFIDIDHNALRNLERTTSHLPRRIADANRQVVALTASGDSFPEVAERLKVHSPEAVSFLPGSFGQPRKEPLRSGAGQHPAIGRTVGMDAIRLNGMVLEEPLRQALARVAAGRGDLAALSRGSVHAESSVFVVFSVAGGTGAGLFLDVIRHVAHAQASAGGDSKIAIYPIVILPSAFSGDVDLKTRRTQQLNGAVALRDIFALTDQANSDVRTQPAFVYPGNPYTTITAPATVQTVSISSRVDTMHGDDQVRAIASYMLSMVSTTVAGDRGERTRSLASEMINDRRSVPAPDGIGLRPATPFTVAEANGASAIIARLFANHLVAEAARQMLEPGHGEDDANRKLFDRATLAGGISALTSERPHVALSPIEGKGAAEITASMQRAQRHANERAKINRAELARVLGAGARMLDAGVLIASLAAEHGPGRVWRVVNGDSKYDHAAAKAGFAGAVAQIAEQPPPNTQRFTRTPPRVPAVQDKLHGLRAVGLNHPDVRSFSDELELWQDHEYRYAMHEQWASLRPQWAPVIERLRELADEYRRPFVSHADGEPAAFAHAQAELCRPRTAISYLLPAGSDDTLVPLYEQARARLCSSLKLLEGASEAQVLDAIMHGQWGQAFDAAREGDDHGGVAFVVNAVERELRHRVLAAAGDERHPLVPSLERVLHAAAHETGEASERDQAGLRRALSNLIPADQRPAGDAGELSGDVFYPAPQKDPAIEKLITDTALVGISGLTARLHPRTGADAITVIMRREAIPATDIPEYREMARVLAQALEHPVDGDFLPWRQRLGHDPVWLMLSDEDRVNVLISFLAALWDGSVKVTAGSEDDPEQLSVHQLDESAGSPIILDLAPTRGQVSRWSGLLSAYERYAISGDPNARDRIQKLIERKRPTAGRQPSPLYRRLLEIAEAEAARAAQLYRDTCEQQRAAGNVGDVPRPVEVQFWSLLREADARNARSPLIWSTSAMAADRPSEDAGSSTISLAG
jgi:Tubulin like